MRWQLAGYKEVWQRRIVESPSQALVVLAHGVWNQEKGDGTRAGCSAVGSDPGPALMKNTQVVALTAAVLLGGWFVASLPAQAADPCETYRRSEQARRLTSVLGSGWLQKAVEACRAQYRSGEGRTVTTNGSGEGRRAQGACWTSGATNPMGRTGSDKWADAMSQLHSHFRRAPNGQRVRVTGYCKGHVRGFAWRTSANATDRHPWSRY